MAENAGSINPQKKFKISKWWLVALALIVILEYVLVSVVLQHFYFNLALPTLLIALLLVFLTERSYINRRIGVYGALTSFFWASFSHL
ncbi:MAG: hypothetical protein ACUVQY_04355 [Thermoproteota archaeon]